MAQMGTHSEGPQKEDLVFRDFNCDIVETGTCFAGGYITLMHRNAWLKNYTNGRPSKNYRA